jgi:hypothetical protein
MSNSRFYFSFRWWHIPLILLVLGLGFLAWASIWDFDPEVKPHIFPSPSLDVKNNAWVGYWVQPFEIRFIDRDNEIPLILESTEPRFVKARQTTGIPLRIKAGGIENLRLKSLLRIRVQSIVTAGRWGLSKTMRVDREMSLPELLNQTIKLTTDVLPQLP